MNKRQTRYALIYILAIFILFIWSFAAIAGDFHKPPYKFIFGNHIDTHQETRLKKKMGKPVLLSGFFYVIDTGENDPVSGLPIFRHPRGALEGEDCNDVSTGCVVGWLINALPGQAKFLYHEGVNGDDHPVWMVNRVDIPQPGSNTHFHWIGRDSTDPRAPDVPNICDQNNAGQLESAGAADQLCHGWFLEIEAVMEFAFQHGNEVVPVYPGIDNTTHLNLVTNYKPNLVITPTRTNEP
jgi:hypothetical protein